MKMEGSALALDSWRQQHVQLPSYFQPLRSQLPWHSNLLTEIYFLTMVVLLRPHKTCISKFCVLSSNKTFFLTTMSTQIVWITSAQEIPSLGVLATAPAKISAILQGWKMFSLIILVREGFHVKEKCLKVAKLSRPQADLLWKGC